LRNPSSHRLQDGEVEVIVFAEFLNEQIASFLLEQSVLFAKKPTDDV
jgi:hypothetical protein